MKQSSPLIVGVGASAGGLDAFESLLNSLGDTPGVAIVFIQHLDPSSKSMLPELLAKATKMEVVPFETGQSKLKANTVYVCPPHASLRLHNGYAILSESEDGKRQLHVIDHFFHSIADDQGDRGIGVVLSGAGSDGTLGLKAISDRGGLTFAQDAKSAKYDSMPRSAATTGVADHVMSPADIANELLRYVKHLGSLGELTSMRQMRDEIDEAIPTIAEALYKATNHNFQHYKSNTLVRRVQRRMQVLKIVSASDYVNFLLNNADEAQSLFRELLIGVTAFFRDPDAFAALKREVLPKIFQQRTPDDCVRIWVAGCANGAEAYTMAILCREVMDRMESPCEVQIFATDIDERSLAIGREGKYPLGISEQVSPERLKRFFVKRGKRYQVTNEIREMVLFSAHNLISDPPFSRQDLISCRNLLIYLGSHLQNKLIPLFHYALRPSGYLLLGPSENIVSHAELFRPVDAKLRISQRKGTALGSATGLIYRSGVPLATNERAKPDHSIDLTTMMQKIVLDEFTPKTVVIDESGQILTSSPNIDKYLKFTGGPPQTNIIKLAVDGLRIGLRAAISDAKTTKRRVEHENMSVRVGDRIQRVMVTVQPMPRLGEDEPLYLVVFQDVGLPVDRDGSSSERVGNINDADAMIAQMERELETTRRDLDKTLQDMEVANEEMKSSNEELLSMNEELQSANEELETSKEEIRASSDAVARANDDLQNLLTSTQIATVFLDTDLNIRSFTPAITDIYDLIPTDVGRPLEKFVPNVIDMPPLPRLQTMSDVARNSGDPTKAFACSATKNEAIEHHITAKSGTAYLRRVLPYRSHTGEIDGVVVTFNDVTQLTDSRQRFELLVKASAQIVWVTSPDGIVQEDSPSWREFTGQTVEQWMGLGWLDALHPDDRQPAISAWKDKVASGEQLSIQYRLRHRDGGYRWTQVNAVPQRNIDGSVRCWIGMNTDIDQQKRFAAENANREAHLRRVIDNMLNFVGVLSPDGTLLEVNQTALRAGGITRDDVIGKPIWECSWWSYDDSIAEEVRQNVQRAVQGEVLRYDVDIRVAGDARATIDFMLVPVRNDEGEVTHLIPSGVDVSDRKAAERRLTDNERRATMALEAGNMAAWEWTPQKSVWEPKLFELLGIPVTDDPSPDLFFQCVHPDDLADLQDIWKRATAGEDEYRTEFRIRSPHGETRWLAAVGMIVRDESGTITSMHGLNWDVTNDHRTAERLRQSEQAALAANESKSAFLANMSHEIRTPMTAILGYADLIRDRIADEEALTHLRTIRRNGDYLLDIINDILDLSKIEAGKLDVEMERFQPARLIEDVRSIMEVRATESGLALEVEYDGELPVVIESDAKRMKQILINLVGNAIKFTREGKIRMRVHYDGGTSVQGVAQDDDGQASHPTLNFDVIDTGIGMTEEQQQKLFKPFSQGDHSVSRDFGGTGLGLAISKRLAVMLGGEVTASSTLGVGSTFTVSIRTSDLPDVELVDYAEISRNLLSAASSIHRSDNTEGEPNAQQRTESDGPQLNCHVLIVDDRRDIRFLSKTLLAKAGATIDECEDGQIAVDHIKSCIAMENCPDLILLDMQMPNLDGYETARALRSLGYDGPIIALTADAMQGDMNDCIAAGCNDYLSKPIDADLLVKKIAEMTKDAS